MDIVATGSNRKAVAFIGRGGDLTLTGISDLVPWWSFTKTVLAMATLRLVESGSLNLNERVEDQPFTLKQLLRHEAGLPDYGFLSNYHEDVAAGLPPWPIPKLLAAINSDRLRYEPGKDWAYSNIGYLKVAQIVEHVSGLDLRDALSQLVFEPCHAKTARLALAPADLNGVQMGDVLSYHPGWVYHGLVVGTVGDAASLLWKLVNGRILKAATLAEMLEGRSVPGFQSENHPDPAYGLGLMVSAENTMDHPIGHSGEGPGSRIAVYAKEGKAAAVWTAVPSALDAEGLAFHLLS